jgi:hypothetical protein
MTRKDYVLLAAAKSTKSAGIIVVDTSAAPIAFIVWI